MYLQNVNFTQRVLLLFNKFHKNIQSTYLLDTEQRNSFRGKNDGLGNLQPISLFPIQIIIEAKENKHQRHAANSLREQLT